MDKIINEQTECKSECSIISPNEILKNIIYQIASSYDKHTTD